METQNQTENVQTEEEKTIGKMEADKAEKVEQHIERTNVKSVIPMAFVTFLAAKPAVYQYQPRRGDLAANKAANHPDVIQLRKDIPALSVEMATRIAWLLWRARQVEFWTMDLHNDRVTKVQGGADIVQKGRPTHTWAACLDAAYLGKHSPTHELAMERRERYYAEQEKQREALESIALTLVQPGPTQEKLDAQPTPVEKALHQAAIQADALLREKEEKAQVEHREIKPVPPKVRKQ